MSRNGAALEVEARGSRDRGAPPRLRDLADLVTVREAAAVLRVSPDSIYAAISANAMSPVVRIGKAIRIPRSTLERLTGIS